MALKQKPAADKSDDRIAPDPLAIVLSALAALGAIASIATINWAAEDQETPRPSGKRKAAMALRDLESCALGLREIFRRLQRSPKLFSGESAYGTLPMKFGVHGPRVDADTAKVYQQLANDIASMLVLAIHNSFATMSAIEDGEIVAPEELFYGFGEQQERLNDLVSKRPTMKVTVGTALEISDRLVVLVRELKGCQVTSA
ncbi:MAG: hypothetical protein RLZ98_1245 [Pseudomonadota bacterium]